MPLHRVEIFRSGLTNALGTVVDWIPGRNFGFIQLNAQPDIDLFLHVSDLPKPDRNQVMTGSQILFDLAPGQEDAKKRPRVANPRLILAPENNYNR